MKFKVQMTKEKSSRGEGHSLIGAASDAKLGNDKQISNKKRSFERKEGMIIAAHPRRMTNINA